MRSSVATKEVRVQKHESNPKELLSHPMRRSRRRQQMDSCLKDVQAAQRHTGLQPQHGRRQHAT